MSIITEAAKKFLATAETWRTDELDVKRRTLADLEHQLATAQEKTRTLPVTIGNLRATIAHIESQTAADIAREAVQAVRGSEQEQPAMSCPSCKREYPDFDGASVVFCDPKKGGCGFCRHVELKGQPMGDKTVMVCTACWEVQEKEQPKPEPYRAGLPPERLRKVWAEWEDETGIVQLRKNGDGWEYRYAHWPNEQEWGDVYGDIWGSANIRPHGATWAEVEAKADAAERALPRPVENCRHVAADGTCGHLNALTPECHDGVACPVSGWGGRQTKGHALAPDELALSVERHAVSVVGQIADHDDSALALWLRRGYWLLRLPTLLDLTKLPPGTVCEATGEIAVPYVFLKLKVGRRFSVVEVMQPPTAEGEDVRVLIGDDTWAFPALVPACVVKEGGEDAPR